jgi:hypothetical protein
LKWSNVANLYLGSQKWARLEFSPLSVTSWPRV